MPVHNDDYADKKEMNFLEPHPVSSKVLKRDSTSQVNQDAEPSQHFRAIKKENIFHGIRVANPSTWLKQADGVVFPRVLLAVLLYVPLQ